MLKNLKYYGALYRHNMSKELAEDRLGGTTLGSIVLSIAFGAAVGAGFGDADGLQVDQISTENAQEIVTQLETQGVMLQEQEDDFDALSKRITIASRAGEDISALEAEQAAAAEALTDFAQQLIANTLLSDELSEQQRQDLLTTFDENIIDVGDVGFSALEENGKIIALSHLREYNGEATEKYSNNIERAQAMATYNDENNDVMSPVFSGGLGALVGALVVLMGLLGSIGSDFHRYAYEKPKKPTASRRGQFKH